MKLKKITMGIAPIIPILVILLVGVSVLLLLSVYSNITGVKTVQNLCKNSIGQYVDCSLIPFQQYPTGTTIQASVPVPVSPTYLGIKDLQILMQDPQSESWSSVAGTMRYFTAGTDVKDPSATAFDTTSISSGAGSESSWNKATTDTQYVLVFDGGGTYYDKLWNPFYFLSANYNKALGTYTLSLDKDNTPPKIGTFAQFFVAGSNSTGLDTVDGLTTDTSLQVADGSASGQFSFQINIKNTGANTVLRDIVLFFKSDVTSPMEGNEFSAVTLQHDSGLDFELPADIRSYVANEVPVAITPSLTGGKSATYTITFTYNSANFAVSTDKLWLGLDDMGGWLSSDVLPANKGATAQAYDLTRAS